MQTDIAAIIDRAIATLKRGSDFLPPEARQSMHRGVLKLELLKLPPEQRALHKEEKAK